MGTSRLRQLSSTRGASGFKYVQIVDVNIESVRKQLLSIISGRRGKSKFHIVGEKNKDYHQPDRHQVMQLILYSEPVSDP